MRPEASDVGIEGVVAKLVDARYRPGRTDAWVKVRQVAVVDAGGAWRQIGLSLPLASRLGRQIGARITLTGEQYLPVRPEVFVEAETDPAVESFSSWQRPRVHRARPDLDADDVQPGRGPGG